jgi:hypothetical protein
VPRPNKRPASTSRVSAARNSASSRRRSKNYLPVMRDEERQDARLSPSRREAPPKPRHSLAYRTEPRQRTDPKGRSQMNDKTTNKRGEVSTPVSRRPHPRKHSPIPSRRDWAVTGLVTLVALCVGVSAPALADPKLKIKFDMLRSTAAMNAGANCAPDATGRVKITSLGPVEEMDVEVSGLPPNSEFDFFVIQLPNAPFGLAWYQGDIETDEEGEGHQSFRGRFNIETFIVAQPPGGQPAPVVHNQPPFPDAEKNPATEPVHTFHLGLWFGSPHVHRNFTCAGRNFACEIILRLVSNPSAYQYSAEFPCRWVRQDSIRVARSASGMSAARRTPVSTA